MIAVNLPHVAYRTCNKYCEIYMQLGDCTHEYNIESQ